MTPTRWVTSKQTTGSYYVWSTEIVLLPFYSQILCSVCAHLSRYSQLASLPSSPLLLAASGRYRESVSCAVKARYKAKVCVILSDIRIWILIPCNVNVKDRWVSEKQPKRLLEGKGFSCMSFSPLMVLLGSGAGQILTVVIKFFNNLANSCCSSTAHHSVLQEIDTSWPAVSYNQYCFVVEAIKFIKIKTRFSLEHVINGSLR